MVDLEDIRLYLPKYLSPGTEEKLLQDLSDFPENIDQRMYGFYGKEEEIVYQGDCLDQMIIINLPDTKIKKSNAVVLSNTCDNDVKNIRKFSTNLVYTPLINLNKYISLLQNSGKFSEESISGHLSEIRNQKITQIFYFPSLEGSHEEHIIFFDRICSCDNRIIDRKKVSDLRKFSLSQYGFYLFLYKLSIHFTRIHEKVDRVY